MNRSVLSPVFKIIILAALGCSLWMVSPHRTAYVIFLSIGIVAAIVNYAKKTETHALSTTGVLALLFAASNVLMLTLPLKGWMNSFLKVSVVSVGLSALLVFAGMFVLFFEIVTCLSHNVPIGTDKEGTEGGRKAFFWGTFVSITVIYTAVLFLSKYPGSIDPDYKNVMDQIYGLSPVTNHHPYYLTMFIKAILGFGTLIFKDVNAAAAIISVLQIIFVAFIEARTVLFFYDLKVKRWLVILCFACFMFNPANMFYSFSIWKDTSFALFLMASCIVVAKICRGMYKEGFSQYLLLGISLLGLALLRSNGLFVLAVWFVVLIFAYRSQSTKLKVTFLAALIVGFVLKNVVLSCLSVPQPDILESLSIPMQQISAVLHNSDVTPEQAEVLSKIVDLDEVRANYDPCWVDFVKQCVRNKGNVDYLNDNKMTYLKTYLAIGLKHPTDYVKAWLYQTQGYWFIKDSFTVWYDGIEPNTHGFVRTVNSEAVAGAVDSYAGWFVKVFHIFTYIALYTWTCIAALGVSINRRNRIGILLSVPAIAVFLSLLIAVPLDAEFRYAYAYIYTAPVVLAVGMLFSEKKEES